MPPSASDTFPRIASQRSFTNRDCSHLDAIEDLGPSTSVCLSCAANGVPWVKLRRCLTCGSVGCCDSSNGAHARAHFETTGHPIMRSIEPGETWGWCYPDAVYLS